MMTEIIYIFIFSLIIIYKKNTKKTIKLHFFYDLHNSALKLFWHINLKHKFKASIKEQDSWKENFSFADTFMMIFQKKSWM